jgi:hypothetical protein
LNPEIQDVLRAQKRQRRLKFWVGFAVIAVIGSLWAGLSKDPLGQGIFGFALIGPLHVFSPSRRVRRTAALALVATGLGLAVLCLALLVPPLSTPAAAQDDEDFATLEVDVLGNIPWQDGQRLSATVTVEAQRAISGTLVVVNSPEGQPSTSYEFDVDVAANTTGVFPLTLTTGWNGVEATAILRANGDVIADDELRRQPNGGDEVAVLATFGIDDAPRRVSEIGDETQLVTVSLDRTLRGLESASSLLVTPAGYNQLAADTESGNRVDGWVWGGGQLVVDGPTASLDSRFHQFPTANERRFAYGAGSVVYAEDWQEGIPLGGYLGRTGMQDLVDSQGLGSGASGELGILAGISLPSVVVIAGVLLAYTFLGGPLLFGMVSARRVQRWIWVALPALSLLFVVGIVGFGVLSRSGTDDVHVTIVEVNDSGSRATTNLLLTSSIGGDRSIDLPDSWTYLGQARTEGQRPAKLRVGASASELSFEVPPGSNATARVLGDASQYDGALVIDNIRLEGDQLTADVSNRGTVDLTEVLAFAGNARAEIGDIGAGETRSVSVDAFDDSTRTMQELLLWPRVEQQWTNSGSIAVPVDRDAKTAAGAWTEWRVESGSLVAPPGVIGVAGWTDDLPSPVGDVQVGRTALVARANIAADAQPEVGFSTVMRLPSRQNEPQFFGNFAGYPQDFRVTLAPGTDVDRLAVRAGRESAGVSFLIDDEWQFAKLTDTGDSTIAIPAAAVTGGEFQFRSFEADWAWGVGVTATIVVDDESAEMTSLSTAPAFRNPEGGDFDQRFGVEADFGQQFEGEIWSSQEFGALTPNEPIEIVQELPGFGYDQYLLLAPVPEQSIKVSISSDDGDPFLEIYDEFGDLLATDDDSGRLNSAELEFIPFDDGVLEVRAQGHGGAMNYVLTIEVIDE